MEEKIRAKVEGIIYQNQDNGYSVLEMCVADGACFVAVGIMPLTAIGETLDVSGTWTEHKTYGRQFKVQRYEVLQPNTLDDIEEYLANGSIKGIGKTKAAQIVEKFGENTFDVLDNTPERLLEISGIGPRTLNDIVTSYNMQRTSRNIMLEMQKMNITPNQAAKLIKVYGDSCVDVIKNNPYRLIDDIENIGFKTADKIAARIGIAHNSPMRIRAGIKFMLEWARQEGHTYLPYEVLVNAVATTLNVERDITTTELDVLLSKHLLVKNIINDTVIVFLPYMRMLEMDIAVRLVEKDRHLNKPVTFDVLREIEIAAKSNSITLAEKQKDALSAMFEKGVVVITGGPGTGKTTILKLAIEIMKKWGMSFELCAPTGRAAKRMTAATGHSAQTIHRLLEYSFSEQCFLRDEDDPIDADFIIIDEMSMVDVPLMDAILKAAHESTRIIMVGDADQLPSVGPGNVLRDILDSGRVYSVRITEIFRQAESSMIISNAHKINNGIDPELDDRDGDFNFYEIYDPNQILNEIVNIFKGKTNILTTEDILNDVQLLAPMKKGIIGVNNLNIAIQNAINPTDRLKPEIQYGDTVFRLGDRVMQMKNNYELEWTRTENGILSEEGKGVFNGDIGIITDVDVRNTVLEVTFESGAVAEYTHDLLLELNLAYCISIHKSQGSEFHTVLMAIAGGPSSFFTRNLLYTAVTRAKEQVCILGRRDCIKAIVASQSTKRRYTALRYMLEEYA